VVGVEYIANLCALTDQCLCHLNDTVESYSGARNTYSTVCSLGLVTVIVLLK